jgi:hypothetical protein
MNIFTAIHNLFRRVTALEAGGGGGGGGGITEVVQDTTPQLGGDLDLNGNSIVAGSATLSPAGLTATVTVHDAVKHIWSGKIGTSEWNAAINLDTDYQTTGEHHLGNPALPAVWLATASAEVASAPYGCFAVQIADPSAVSGDVWHDQGDPYALHVTTHGTDGTEGVAGRFHLFRNWTAGNAELWLQGTDITPHHTFCEKTELLLSASTSWQALTGFTAYTDTKGIFSAGGRFAIPAGENWEIVVSGTVSQDTVASAVQVNVFPIDSGADGTSVEMGIAPAALYMPINFRRVVTGVANRVYEVRLAFPSTPTNPVLRAPQILVRRLSSALTSTLSSYVTGASLTSTLSGYQTLLTAASQAEMEAGAETALRSMSPLRVKQAIAALGGGTGTVTMKSATGASVFSSTTLADMHSSLQLALTPGTYAIILIGSFTGSVATEGIGLGFGFTGTATVTDAFGMALVTSSTETYGAGTTIGSALFTGSAGPGTARWPLRMELQIVVTASGTFKPQAKAETGGAASVTIPAGAAFIMCAKIA